MKTLRNLLVSKPTAEVFSPFFGKKFERFCRKEFIPRLFPDYNQIGRWWHKDKEIDIVGINKEQETILFIECKWNELQRRDVASVLQDLKRKANSVQWNNKTRTEIHGIIGKKIREKKSLKQKGVLLFDLRDIMQEDKEH